jgi:hypothetical protein
MSMASSFVKRIVIILHSAGGRLAGVVVVDNDNRSDKIERPSGKSLHQVLGCVLRLVDRLSRDFPRDIYLVPI